MMTVKCGECRHFVRDGKCNWYASDDAKRKDRPFAHAPFWVWSDCYSDKEQVRANVTSACPTFLQRAALSEPPCGAAVTPHPVAPNTQEEGSP